MRHSRGFTLIEVVVALTLASVVALLVQRLFAATADSVEVLRGASERLSQESNGRRVVQGLLGSLDIGPREAEFRGGPLRIEFASWFGEPYGWPVRARHALFASEGALVATTGKDTLALLCNVRALEVDYLLSSGSNEAWVRAWESPSSAPRAVRLRLARDSGVDTLLILVGARG